MSDRQREANLAVQVLSSRHLATPSLGRLLVEPKRVDDGAGALDALRKFGGRGWLCLTDRVLDVERADDVPASGVPLSAELCKEQESLHLRQDGAAWHLVRFVRAEGDEHLVFTERRPRLGGGTLVYEVAWRRESDAWRPWCARLSAVESEGA